MTTVRNLIYFANEIVWLSKVNKRKYEPFSPLSHILFTQMYGPQCKQSKPSKKRGKQQLSNNYDVTPSSLAYNLYLSKRTKNHKNIFRLTWNTNDGCQGLMRSMHWRKDLVPLPCLLFYCNDTHRVGQTRTDQKQKLKHFAEIFIKFRPKHLQESKKVSWIDIPLQSLDLTSACQTTTWYIVFYHIDVLY